MAAGGGGGLWGDATLYILLFSALPVVHGILDGVGELRTPTECQTPVRYPHSSCFLTNLPQGVTDTTALPSTQRDVGQGVGRWKESAL